MKRLWVWPVWDIKFVRSGLYGEEKFRKDNRNDITADVAQYESSNIKCYTLAFSNKDRKSVV